RERKKKGCAMRVPGQGVVVELHEAISALTMQPFCLFAKGERICRIRISLLRIPISIQRNQDDGQTANAADLHQRGRTRKLCRSWAAAQSVANHRLAYDRRA